MALGKAQASLALLSLLRCCSSQTGDDEAGTLGVRRVESDLVAHQGGQAARQRQTDAKAVLLGVKAYEGLEDALRIVGSDGWTFVGDGNGVGAVATVVAAHLHRAAGSILVGIVEQTVEQFLQHGIRKDLHLIRHVGQELPAQMAVVVDGRGRQVVTVEDGAGQFVQLDLMILLDLQIVAVEAVEDELLGGGGHMVGIAANASAQLHIILARYFSVALDDDLRCADQREQRRAQAGSISDSMLRAAAMMSL